MARAKDILCPYCFSRWSTSTAAFRCTSTDEARCKRVPDEELGRLRGTSAPMEGRVILKTGRLGQAFAIKQGQPVRCECGAATRPVCPACHCNLPQRFTEADARTMALIGTRASGKTHYIAVALHELEHRVGPKFGGSLMLLDDPTRNRVEKVLLPRLFGEQAVLQATQSASADGSAREPLVSRLTLGRDKHATHSNLVFFDAAGEDLQSLTLLEREARYVTQSDGLILLIDPLQIAAIRDELHDERELPPVTADPYTMLGRLAALMREARGLAANKSIDVPLAITLSKSDMLRGLLPEEHLLFRGAQGNGRLFDGEAARNLSEQLRADVVGWLGERFDTFVKAEFSRAAYFGVSALGENPVQGRLRNGIAAQRVEDPILWMLGTWGAIPKS